MLLSTTARQEPTLELVGTAGDAREAVEVAVMRRPQVVLLDLDMPLGGGTAAATEIRAKVPDARIVALSANDSQVAMLEMAGRARSATSSRARRRRRSWTRSAARRSSRAGWRPARAPYGVRGGCGLRHRGRVSERFGAQRARWWMRRTLGRYIRHNVR